jgi:hypothetical protein
VTNGDSCIITSNPIVVKIAPTPVPGLNILPADGCNPLNNVSVVNTSLNLPQIGVTTFNWTLGSLGTYSGTTPPPLTFTNTTNVNKKDTIRGCFGSQALVTWDFLKKMDDEYGFFNIINYVKNRHERYNIERLFGLVAIHALIYCYDYPPTVWQDISILGDITQYPRWGMSWETYQSYLSSGYDFRDQHDSPARMIKVFSGR